MERAQKEYYLNEKMKAIQKELGRKDDRATRSTSSGKQDRAGAHDQGRRGEGAPGAEAARVDAADVGRGHRLAQLPRLADRGALAEEDPRAQGPGRRRADPGRGPLRAREGQGAHPRVPGRAPAREQAQGPDPVLRRPPGRRQDLARHARSRAPRAASSCACRSAACATRRRSAATAAPTSARCPARSSR